MMKDLVCEKKQNEGILIFFFETERLRPETDIC